MSDFWFWFSRPFAEFLGAIAVYLGLFVALVIGVMVWAAFETVRDMVAKRRKS